MKRLQRKNIPHFAPILLFFALIYLCWKLASLFWLVLAPPQAVQVETIRLGSQQQSIPQIGHFSLFQQPNAVAATNQNLPMKLQGVMLGSARHLSSVVILLDQQTERYRIGDSIANTGYQVHDIQWNRVNLIHQNGSMQELRFEGIEAGLNQSMSMTPPTNMTVTPNHVAPVISDPNPVEDAIQKLQQDRQQYLKEMGVNSAGNGYEITSQTPAVLRQRLGLQPGDKILSLNGQNIGQGQNEGQLLELAKQQGQVRLEIQRGNQVMTIQQDFK